MGVRGEVVVMMEWRGVMLLRVSRRGWVSVFTCMCVAWEGKGVCILCECVCVCVGSCVCVCGR